MQTGYLKNWLSPIELGFSPVSRFGSDGTIEYRHPDGRSIHLGSTYSYDPAHKSGFFVAVYE